MPTMKISQAKMGRPAKPPGERLGTTVSYRISAAQQKALKRKAKAGETLAQTARRLALDEL